MAGMYCRYCGQRCFVYRVLPDGSWAGHMATCPDGMAHDRTMLGFDHKTAVNPLAQASEERADAEWQHTEGTTP